MINSTQAVVFAEIKQLVTAWQVNVKLELTKI